MSLISSIVCVNCAKIYDESRKPCLGTCHDSVCQQCRQEMKVFNCPVCGKKDAFKEEKINWNGIPMQEAILKDLTEDSIEEFIKKQNDKNSGPCQECGDLAKKLRICLDCASEQEVLIPRGEFFKSSRKSNVTSLGAFFKAKQFSICANCATDGEHAEHKCDLLAKVYDEKTVDVELDLVLRRVMDLKYKKEMEKYEDGSDWHWLYIYKKEIVKFEMFRKRRIDWQPGGTSVNSSFNRMNPDILGEMIRVMEEVALYERKIQMMTVEEIQMRLEESEDEKFKEEMRKVAGKMLTEEEKLWVEEWEKVEEKVKERILKHCEMEGRTGLDDREKAGEELEKARVCAQRLQIEFFTHPMKELKMKIVTVEEFEQKYAVSADEKFEKEMVEEFKKMLKENPGLRGQWSEEEFFSRIEKMIGTTHKIVCTFGEEAEELHRKLKLAELEYYKACAEELLCFLVLKETIQLMIGEGIQLEHPNLQKYLDLMKGRKAEGPGVDKFYFDSVLHFPM